MAMDWAGLPVAEGGESFHGSKKHSSLPPARRRRLKGCNSSLYHSFLLPNDGNGQSSLRAAWLWKKIPFWVAAQVQVEEIVFYSVHNPAPSTSNITLPSTTTPPIQHSHVHYKV